MYCHWSDDGATHIKWVVVYLREFRNYVNPADPQVSESLPTLPLSPSRLDALTWSYKNKIVCQEWVHRSWYSGDCDLAVTVDSPEYSYGIQEEGHLSWLQQLPRYFTPCCCQQDSHSASLGSYTVLIFWCHPLWILYSFCQAHSTIDVIYVARLLQTNVGKNLEICTLFLWISSRYWNILWDVLTKCVNYFNLKIFFFFFFTLNWWPMLSQKLLCVTFWAQCWCKAKLCLRAFHFHYLYCSCHIPVRYNCSLVDGMSCKYRLDDST